MKNWRHNIALGLAAILLAGLSWAQTPAQGDQDQPAPPPTQQQGQMGEMGPMHHRGMSPEQHMEMLARRLNLTDAQKAQVKQLIEKHRSEIDAINNEKLTRDERMQKMKALHQQMQSEMKGILTPEQQKKFEQMHQNMRKGRRHGHRGPGNAPPPPPPGGAGAGF